MRYITEAHKHASRDRMQRRTFLTLSAATTGAVLFRPSMTLFSRSGLPSDEKQEDMLTDLVDAAISQGAEYADARLLSKRDQSIQLRKDVVTSLTDTEERGVNLRVYRNGGWATVALSLTDRTTPRQFASRALAAAAIAAAINPQPFIDEGRARGITGDYETPLQRDPFEVPLQEKIALLRDIATRPLTMQAIPQSVANLFLNRTESMFSSSHDARLRQRFSAVYQNYAVTAFDRPRRIMESRSSPREAGAGGWEIVEEYTQSELDTVMHEALQKLAAETPESGAYTVLIDATVLWDLICDTLLPHFDVRRILQRDGLRPGGRWISEEMIGKTRIASNALTLGWDNTLPGGLATCAWDDVGRAADQGVLMDQGLPVSIVASDEHSVQTPRLLFSRSSSWRQTAQCNMPNISLASTTDKALHRMIADIDEGLLIRGRGSIVTNAQRTVLRLRPQIGWRIRNGEVGALIRDFEIEVSTEQLWNSLVETGGTQTRLLAGELFPDRSYPLWTQPFSVDAPAGLFHELPVYSLKDM
jgi:TldD protein